MIESKLEDTINAIAPLDQTAMQAAADRQQRLTKPRGALGRLEALSVQLAGIQGCERPRFRRRAIVVAAASHGVAAEGVSAYPASVTAQMVLNFLHGGAAINALADNAGAELVVVDAGVDPVLPAHRRLRSAKLAPGTRNMLHERAMPHDHARQIVEAGIDLVQELARKGITLIGLGEMGIGNTTAAAAIVAATTGAPVERVTGRGTQIDDEQLLHKQAVIQQALSRHEPDAHDGLDLLGAVGGYEIGFMAGCCLGAAVRRIPVVLDGYITAAAAIIAQRLAPAAQPYFIAAHRSTEPGHSVALQDLQLEPLLDLEMRLGEGSGAALAMPIIVAAARTLDEMATFQEAAVDNNEQ
jgi:nicotinate-nucleotide--dimethylbenzimidazole phosphoribosyltransferase